MQVRVITMKYNEGQQGFSEEALRSATFGRDVLACETHFFTHGGAPHLTLVLQLADASGFDAERSFKPRDPNAPNPEEALPEELRGVYRDLKKWRNEKAKAEGRPAYAIARNTQLAELVAKAPKTKAAIKEIEGLGESFVERYGDEVLGMLAQVNVPAARDAPPYQDGETVGRVAPRPPSDGELPL